MKLFRHPVFNVLGPLALMTIGFLLAYIGWKNL